MYKQIKVTTKDGKEYIAKHSDYYILDGFLTVYRDEEIEDSTMGIMKVTYHKFHTHYALDCVSSIEVIE